MSTKVTNKRKPRKLSTYRAHEIARARAREHALERAEIEADSSEEFAYMLEAILTSTGIRMENQGNIIIQMTAYWITGERDRARAIYDKLFTPQQVATFQPSE